MITNVNSISFNEEMIRALIDGRKTVTRRPVSNDVAEAAKFMGENGESSYDFVGLMYSSWKDDSDAIRHPEYLIYCTEYPEEGVIPIGQGIAKVNDLIFVREDFLPDPDCEHDSWDDHTLSYHSWAECNCSYEDLPDALKTTDYCLYKADNNIDSESLKWIPSKQMPLCYSRLALKVTDVRIEQVEDITTEQAIAEGMPVSEEGQNPIIWFKNLWNEIYSNWDKNPFVWVIEFKVMLSKPCV